MGVACGLAKVLIWLMYDLNSWKAEHVAKSGRLTPFVIQFCFSMSDGARQLELKIKLYRDSSERAIATNMMFSMFKI